MPKTQSRLRRRVFITYGEREPNDIWFLKRLNKYKPDHVMCCKWEFYTRNINNGVTWGIVFCNSPLLRIKFKFRFRLYVCLPKFKINFLASILLVPLCSWLFCVEMADYFWQCRGQTLLANTCITCVKYKRNQTIKRKKGQSGAKFQLENSTWMLND